MNTDSSREFTDKAMADKIGKRRGKTVFVLGKNKKGNNVYFVGEYTDALQARWKYTPSTDKRSPKRK